VLAFSTTGKEAESGLEPSRCSRNVVECEDGTGNEIGDDAGDQNSPSSHARRSVVKCSARPAASPSGSDFARVHATGQ